MSTNLTLTLGRDDEFTLRVKDDDGTAYPLDGCTLALAVKLTGSGADLLRLAPGTGLTIVDADAGEVKALFTAAAKTAAGLSDLVEYRWDLLVTDPFGLSPPNDDLTGPVTVNPSFTQPVS